jgi:hypothetical protein
MKSRHLLTLGAALGVLSGSAHAQPSVPQRCFDYEVIPSNFAEVQRVLQARGRLGWRFIVTVPSTELGRVGLVFERELDVAECGKRNPPAPR